MGVFYETIPKSLVPWILEQKMLWVGSAPLSGDGHINISPKGGQYFGIIDERTFWFMDLTGSGVETTAHLRELGNGRIVVMFMAFEGPARILRIWGKGSVLENGSKDYDDFVRDRSVKTLPGSRSIILVDVHQVATSCGFSVPFYDFKAFRPTLNEFFEKKEKAYLNGKADESMDKYWAYKSQLSIDGLPGMKRGYEYAQKHKIAPLKKMVGPYAPKAPRTSDAMSPIYLVFVALLSFVMGAAITLTLVSPGIVQRIQEGQKVF
ncbi:pyridoxamine phosphate oxidase family protein [Zopfia rhizophila CBS 207.26]|uniref:Pyridoxamine phosphate oxidase family protein n=1 Tax=Zopfia rhizophila CBS 207.26 TaxID=1314779 RepID=A0A6A6ESJ9_9PEZI|nr:pyridoxamine phosphate oxidase family protein [Zopfia rhizophila CBS 207.26]